MIINQRSGKRGTYTQEEYKSVKTFQSRLTTLHLKGYLEGGKGTRKDLGGLKGNGFYKNIRTSG